VRSGEKRNGLPACPLHPADESTAWLLLLRHAPSIWNDAQRRQGWADPPLTRAAAAAAQQWSPSRPPCLRAASSSDLRRASQTARLEGRWLRVDLRASVAESIGPFAVGEVTPGRLAGTAETSWTVRAGGSR
jgi:hypothetical protein